MWVKYNPNPAGRQVGDCAVRALTKALNIDWETAYTLMSNNGFNMCDMPSSDGVWGAVLRQHGFLQIRCIKRLSLLLYRYGLLQRSFKGRFCSGLWWALRSCY